MPQLPGTAPPTFDRAAPTDRARGDGAGSILSELNAAVCAQWREMRRDELTLPALQRFYAQYKYLVMSRHVATYKKLGRLLAQPGANSLETLAEQAIALILGALARPATRAGNVNVMLHIRGYLKRDLNKAQKLELSESIEKYRCGEVALAVPLALLRHHFEQYPNRYIEQQAFMRSCLDDANSHALSSR